VPLADSCSYQTESGACVSSGLATVVVGSCVVAAIVLGYLAFAYNRQWLPFRPVPRFWNSWLGRALSAVGHWIRDLDDPTMYDESLSRDEEERSARQERIGAVSEPADGRPETLQWPWYVGFVVVVIAGGDLLASAASINLWIGQALVVVALFVGAGVYGRRRKRRIEWERRAQVASRTSPDE
jgi:hypothetical protein